MDGYDTGSEPRLRLAMLVIKSIAFGVLLTASVWVIASYAFDWAGFR